MSDLENNAQEKGTKKRPYLSLIHICIIELGDKKELVTQEDLPYIVSDVLKHGMAEERVSLKSYICLLYTSRCV